MLDPGRQRSRRAVLAAAAGGVAALAAGAIARPLPAEAAGDDGATIHVGDQLVNAQSTTELANSTNANTVFYAASGAGGVALAGDSNTNYGVLGTSVSGWGVWGANQATDKPATTGISVGSNTGVYGQSGGSPAAPTTGAPSLAGSSPIPSPLDVVYAPQSKTGVFGTATQDSSARGVWGKTTVGQGVRGEATTTGIGVYATAPTTGVALRAAGKVSFSRSGHATMAAGTSSKAVSLAGVTTSSLIFAVLASNRSGRFVRAVVAASGSFTIYLNTTVLSSTLVSWFVLN